VRTCSSGPLLNGFVRCVVALIKAPRSIRTVLELFVYEKYRFEHCIMRIDAGTLDTNTDCLGRAQV